MEPKPFDEERYEGYTLALLTDPLADEELELNATAANLIVDWFFEKKVVSKAQHGKPYGLAELRQMYRQMVLPPALRRTSSRVRENAFQDAHNIYRSLRLNEKVKYRRDCKEPYLMFRVNGHIVLDERTIKFPGAPRLRWECPALKDSSLLDEVVLGRKRFIAGTVYKHGSKWFVRLLMLRDGVTLISPFAGRPERQVGEQEVAL